MTFSLRQRGISAVVLDIEGTTTPIAFVYEVLFPFARANLRRYFTEEAQSPAARALLARLRDEWSADVAQGHEPPRWPDADADFTSERSPRAVGVAAYVEWLMDRDRKSPGLKELQGLIWERGYRDGILQGEVFADVPPALERWRAASVDIAIYSSGSELAQRLIFGHTQYGDLTPYFGCFFDTRIGAKISSDSYRRIAGSLGRPAHAVLFVSDIAAELDAARLAGLSVVLCVRPGNRPQAANDFAVIESFGDIV